MTDLDRIRELFTERLRLRQWVDADRAPFAALNADPEVMRYFPAPLDEAASNAYVDRIREHFAEHGYGLWAVETRHDGRFIGYVGLWPVGFDADFTPAVEIGWRLASQAWGRGYAPEAAEAAAADGFERLGLHEIVSFTAVGNAPSRRVMEKLGMTRDSDEDFDHPKLPEGDPLRRHVLYRLAKPE